jgi:hypothetical protein
MCSVEPNGLIRDAFVGEVGEQINDGNRENKPKCLLRKFCLFISTHQALGQKLTVAAYLLKSRASIDHAPAPTISRKIEPSSIA